MIYIATDKAIEIEGHYPESLARAVVTLPRLIEAADALLRSPWLLPKSNGEKTDEAKYMEQLLEIIRGGGSEGKDGQ